MNNIPGTNKEFHGKNICKYRNTVILNKAKTRNSPSSKINTDV